MEKQEIEKIRMNIGKFLHSYYLKFGEKKYEKFIEKVGEAISKSYGESFTSDNLRIMEAEYVTLNLKIDEKIGTKSKKNID